MGAFLAGFFLGFSLILAIGAQNAFVLRQGLLRQHVLAVSLVCALSDAVLVMAGIVGFGKLVAAMSWLKTAMALAGAVFLTCYGVKSFWAAFTEGSVLKPSEQKTTGLKKTIAICLAFTWLNPHVYLDTVVLLGTISVNYGADRFIFGMGAIAASFIFFFALGFGSRFLEPIFRKPAAWKIFEVAVGTVMFLLAAKLVLRVG